LPGHTSEGKTASVKLIKTQFVDQSQPDQAPETEPPRAGVAESLLGLRPGRQRRGVHSGEIQKADGASAAGRAARLKLGSLGAAVPELGSLAASSTRRTRWVTFDCFGTLVDWNTGFANLLTPLFGPQTSAVLRAYHHWERELEAGRPHRLYREVLPSALLRAAAAVGVSLSEARARTLLEGWGLLPVFPDVEHMLERLRGMGCRLAVLTNCDNDLFAQTARAFRQPFDLVITAEQAGTYKPSARHFERFAEVTRVARRDWVHVACSWYHDISPARTLGIQRVWLDRDETGQDERAASARVESAAEVSLVVGKLYEHPAA
jgi:2-haloacid dehalogenase